MSRHKKPSHPRDHIAGLLHSIRVHSALFVSIVVGFVLFLLLPQNWELSARLVLSWDVGALVYLGFALSTIFRFSLSRAKSRAADQDEGATLILMLTVIAAAVSLGAVVSLLGIAKNADEGYRSIFLLLGIMTTLISWMLIHTMFALHYAHEYYGGEDVGRGGGLKFPNEPQPDYWDFVYFSFVIGMTFQVSDVQVTRKRVRRLVVAHGIVSFFFSVTIIALMVNIGSTLI
ncbi:MAG: DUF1345 domain-containing protein [Pseudorhodoplanes sp.]|jgi:uncharacterized membrane protein|nr:DUF1345 domain-containing protein [Pseudorhodoplanes sp.]